MLHTNLIYKESHPEETRPNQIHYIKLAKSPPPLCTHPIIGAFQHSTPISTPLSSPPTHNVALINLDKLGNYG